RPKGRHHLPEGRAVRRLRALSFLAEDGLDGPAVAGTVLPAGLFLDVEGQVRDLFLRGYTGVDVGVHGFLLYTLYFCPETLYHDLGGFVDTSGKFLPVSVRYISRSRRAR